MNLVLQAIFWALLQHGVRLALALLTSLGIARALGPELYGSYQSVLSWILIFVAVATGGLQSVVIQRLASQTEDARVILGSAFRMRMVWTGLAVLSCLTIPALQGWPDQEMVGLLILIPVLAMQFGDLADYHFQSLLQQKRPALARLAGSLLTLLLVSYGLWAHLGLYYFLGAFVGEQLGGFILLTIFNEKYGIPFRTWKFDAPIAAELWQEAWPMLGATLGLLLYTRIDVVMLTQMRGLEEAGYFAAASRLALLWNFVPLAIVGAMFPKLAKLKAQQASDYFIQARFPFEVLGFLGFGFGVFLAWGATLWVPLLLGHAYEKSVGILAVQGVVTWLYFVRTGLDRFWVTEKLARFSLGFHLATALVNIGLNWFLIPRMGAVGAAWASTIAMALGAWIFPWIFPATRTGARLALQGTWLWPRLLYPHRLKNLRQIWKN